MTHAPAAAVKNTNSAADGNHFTITAYPVWMTVQEDRVKNYFTTGCQILGILCFIYYIIIIAFAGWRTSIAGIWILGGGCFLFMGWGLRYLQMHPQSKLRVALWGMGVLLAVGVLLLLVLGSRVVKGMKSKAPSGLEYAIVLGAQVKGTRPSRSLQRRLDAALAYAQQNPDTVFILSGGQGTDEEISEAECMYVYMLAQGMDADRLLLEDRSTSTKENLEFSDELYGLKDKQVGIISNSFHIYRALRLARQTGYQAVWGIPASSEPIMQPHNILREVVCILYAEVLGRV